MPVHCFEHPRLTVRLALGHKYRGWYLLFAQPYRTADSREIARLDAHASGTVKSSRRSSWAPRPRFWFDAHARSGWEQGGETLLDLLLSLDLHEPPLFAVVDHEPASGASKVEVLVPEEQLARYCEGCGRWEVAGDGALRWFMVHSDNMLPGYLCPPCHTKDWIGARAIRSLKRIIYMGCG
ncbi:hypothetical protein B0H19DRAFT_1080502 [Mycena capillaripes]|nr:hypothetical protein B0H19DRAFT_1080502 [Mycena capillaripes]